MLKLRFKNNKQNAVWLVEPKVTIGRKFTNDLIVEDPEVSDLHAEILVKHENLTLVNLMGGNNVLINNQIVNNTAPLNINDEVIVGGTLLEVVDPKLEARPAAKKSDAVQSTAWAIKAHSAALGNRVFPLKTLTVVGRSNDCDITLAASHLSRRHAELSVRKGLLYLKDLGSANGTYLNGERVTEARVKRGDELRFDTLSFGVIGPSEDLDKTTVRPVVAIDAALAPSANKKTSPMNTPSKAGVLRSDTGKNQSIVQDARINSSKNLNADNDSEPAVSSATLSPSSKVSIQTKTSGAKTPAARANADSAAKSNGAAKTNSAVKANKAATARRNREDVSNDVQTAKVKPLWLAAALVVLAAGLGIAYQKGLFASLF